MLAALGQTFSNYKCNSSICYGIDGGTTHAVFKEFQYQLNRAGGKLSGWKPISIDGFIGSETLNAYRILKASGVYYGAQLPSAYSFVDLSGKVATGTLLYDVRDLADEMTTSVESAGEIQSRAETAAQEGSTTTASTPVRSDGSPTTLAPVGSGRPGLSLKMGVGITAALAAVGLVGVALYQKSKKRRRRRR